MSISHKNKTANVAIKKDDNSFWLQEYVGWHI